MGRETARLDYIVLIIMLNGQAKKYCGRGYTPTIVWGSPWPQIWPINTHSLILSNFYSRAMFSRILFIRVANFTWVDLWLPISLDCCLCCEDVIKSNPHGLRAHPVSGLCQGNASINAVMATVLVPVNAGAERGGLSNRRIFFRVWKKWELDRLCGRKNRPC